MSDKKKYIRRQSVISKLQSFPFDFYLYINEIITSIDWNSPQAIHIANVLGISLTLLDLLLTSLLNYYDSINNKSNNLLFNSNYSDYQYLKRNLTINPSSFRYTEDFHINWLLSLISNVIIFISVGNLIILIQSSRKYGLLYLTQDNSKSTSIYKSSSWIRVIDSVIFKLFGKDQPDDTTQNSIDNEETTVIEDDTYYMNTWDPNKFNLHLFIMLNPINIVIIHISTIFIALTMNFLIITMFWIIISKFNQLIIDKQIIYQEMFKEYNTKFVNPKLNILKKDVVIDATNGRYNTMILTDKQPYLLSKTKRFVTHDSRGKEVVEYGESIPKYTFIDHSTLIKEDERGEREREREREEETPWYTSSTPYQPRIHSPSMTSTPNRLLSPSHRLDMSNRPVLGYDNNNNESSSRHSFTSPSPVRLGIRSGSVSPSRTSPRRERHDFTPYDRYDYDNERREYERRQSYDERSRSYY
ncbi:Meiotically up-regulated protein [Spathaspora sp. JA1]|nr:Meiotically up-regulated protein [Spathaspora sp. JA1]